MHVLHVANEVCTISPKYLPVAFRQYCHVDVMLAIISLLDDVWFGPYHNVGDGILKLGSALDAHCRNSSPPINPGLCSCRHGVISQLGC